MRTLVAESAKKSKVCWLSWDGRAPRLVWHVWYDDALVVLSGDEGQELPGLDASATVEVTMRSKDTGGRLVDWRGTVEVLPPEAESWSDHAAALLGARLNLTDPQTTLATWRSTGVIVRVVPTVSSEGDGSGPLP